MNPCYDPTIELVYDDLEWDNPDDLEYLGEFGFSNVRNQLKYLSWPPLAVRAPEKFVFDDTAGRDIPVYILDTGANLGKPASSSDNSLSGIALTRMLRNLIRSARISVGYPRMHLMMTG